MIFLFKMEKKLYLSGFSDEKFDMNWKLRYSNQRKANTKLIFQSI